MILLPKRMRMLKAMIKKTKNQKKRRIEKPLTNSKLILNINKVKKVQSYRKESKVSENR